jgi:hypothetical protein
MVLADAGALWKLGFCAADVENKKSDIAAHVASEPAKMRRVAFKIALTSYLDFRYRLPGRPAYMRLTTPFVLVC